MGGGIAKHVPGLPCCWPSPPRRCWSEPDYRERQDGGERRGHRDRHRRTAPESGRAAGGVQAGRRSGREAIAPDRHRAPRAQLSLGQVLRTGGKAVVVVVLCIVLAILAVRFVSMRMGCRTAWGRCSGWARPSAASPAIVATAPAIEAKQEETSLPWPRSRLRIAGGRDLSAPGAASRPHRPFFGTWAGTAVNDTSQVVATGLIYSQKAGEVATVVKLTRNLFMAPVIVVLSSIYLAPRAERGGRRGEEGRRLAEDSGARVRPGIPAMAVLTRSAPFPRRPWMSSGPPPAGSS